MKKEKRFPRFWFEGNTFFYWVESEADLQRVFDNYKGHMTPDKILDKARCSEYDLTIDNFGLRSEHTGKLTLRRFLSRNGIKFKRANSIFRYLNFS
jgi:hypothetical protein